jgi:hypothetical protein
MRRLFVPVTKSELDTLVDIAFDERRRPQDQAAVFLSRALEQHAGERVRAPLVAGDAAPRDVGKDTAGADGRDVS